VVLFKAGGQSCLRFASAVALPRYTRRVGSALQHECASSLHFSSWGQRTEYLASTPSSQLRRLPKNSIPAIVAPLLTGWRKRTLLRQGRSGENADQHNATETDRLQSCRSDSGVRVFSQQLLRQWRPSRRTLVFRGLAFGSVSNPRSAESRRSFCRWDTLRPPAEGNKSAPRPHSTPALSSPREFITLVGVFERSICHSPWPLPRLSRIASRLRAHYKPLWTTLWALREEPILDVDIGHGAEQNRYLLGKGRYHYVVFRGVEPWLILAEHQHLGRTEDPCVARRGLKSGRQLQSPCGLRQGQFTLLGRPVCYFALRALLAYHQCESHWRSDAQCTPAHTRAGKPSIQPLPFLLQPHHIWWSICPQIPLAWHHPSQATSKNSRLSAPAAGAMLLH
jgi:hypothetical protein